MYDEAGLYFAKEHTNLKLGDTRFPPDNDDMLLRTCLMLPISTFESVAFRKLVGATVQQGVFQLLFDFILHSDYDKCTTWFEGKLRL